IKASDKLACRLAHSVLAVSPSLRTAIGSEGICATEKVTVLLGGSVNGVDTSRFERTAATGEMRTATREAYGIPLDSFVVGFVGRLVKDKGLVELTDAWRLLRAEFPDIHLLLVGPFESEDPIPPKVTS